MLKGPISHFSQFRSPHFDPFSSKMRESTYCFFRLLKQLCVCLWIGTLEVFFLVSELGFLVGHSFWKPNLPKNMSFFKSLCFQPEDEVLPPFTK